MDVKITLFPYIIQPHLDNDGRVLIEIMRVDATDAHDHEVGPTATVVVAQLFDQNPPPAPNAAADGD